MKISLSFLDRSVAEIKLFDFLSGRDHERKLPVQRVSVNDSCEIVQLIREERKWTLNGLVRTRRKEGNSNIHVPPQGDIISLHR